MPVQPPRVGGKGPPQVIKLSDVRARDEAQREDRHRSEQLAEVCGRTEEDLELLKARYELYLLGIERREPTRERDEMRRRVARLKGEFTRNSGLRFRIETINARFLAYDRLWTRSAREKEDGTYRRDLLRARRQQAAAAGTRRKEAGAPVPQPPPAAAGAPPAAPGPEARGAPPLASAVDAQPATPAAPVHGGTGGLSPEQLRSLYDAYVDAKKRCNEDVSRLSYEALARTIAKQLPGLIEKYGARSVEFRVVIKDGKAVLKAVPRA